MANFFSKWWDALGRFGDHPHGGSNNLPPPTDPDEHALGVAPLGHVPPPAQNSEGLGTRFIGPPIHNNQGAAPQPAPSIKPGPALDNVISGNPGNPSDTQKYWTPDRMRSAKPIDIGVKGPAGDTPPLSTPIDLGKTGGSAGPGLAGHTNPTTPVHHDKAVATGNVVSSGIGNPDDTQKYWTDERMRSAKPQDMGIKGGSGEVLPGGHNDDGIHGHGKGVPIPVLSPNSGPSSGGGLTNPTGDVGPPAVRPEDTLAGLGVDPTQHGTKL